MASLYPAIYLLTLELKQSKAIFPYFLPGTIASLAAFVTRIFTTVCAGILISHLWLDCGSYVLYTLPGPVSRFLECLKISQPTLPICNLPVIFPLSSIFILKAERTADQPKIEPAKKGECRAEG